MRTKILLASLIVLLATSWAIVRAQAPAGNSADEQAIRKGNEAFCEAFNKANLDGMMAGWAADAEYVDDEGKSTKGRDKIAALFKEQIAGLKGHTMKLTVTGIRFIRPDIAIEDGVSELISPEGTTDAGRYVSLWTKGADGKWQFARVQDLPGDVDTAATSNYKYLKELEWLVGTWSFDVPEKEVSATMTCRWVMNKNFLDEEYTIKLKGEEAMTVKVLLGWDPAASQIRSWFFDSKGGHGEGTWSREGRKWISQTIGVLSDGRTGTSTNSVEFVDDNTFIWRSQDREIEGNVMPDTEVKFTRKVSP